MEGELREVKDDDREVGNEEADVGELREVRDEARAIVALLVPLPFGAEGRKEV